MTSKLALIFLFTGFCAASLAESLPLGKMGKTIQPNEIDVQWSVLQNKFPPNLWVYHVLKTKFSPAVISNLIDVGNFSAKDQTGSPTGGAEESQFLSSDKTRRLTIQSSLGAINYENKIIVQTSQTNLPVEVPQQSELRKLTMDFLPKIGIRDSDIKRDEEISQPELTFFDPEVTMYWVNSAMVTNIPYRSVFFRRSLKGVSFVGNDVGGNCWINFASHRTISKIVLKWPEVERFKSYPVASFQSIIKWIHQGRSVHGYIPMDFGTIDWPAAKKITVTKAQAVYVTGQNYIHPIASLWATVDTGHGNVEVEIDCPIIDESAN